VVIYGICHGVVWPFCGRSGQEFPEVETQESISLTLPILKGTPDEHLLHQLRRFSHRLDYRLAVPVLVARRQASDQSDWPRWSHRAFLLCFWLDYFHAPSRRKVRMGVGLSDTHSHVYEK